MATIGQLATAAREAYEESQDFYSCFVPTWSENQQGYKFISDININYKELVRVLKYLGFYRYDVGNESRIVRVSENVLEEVETHNIVDAFENHIEAMPSDHTFSHAQSKIINKLYANQKRWFSNEILMRLRTNYNIVFNSDTENEAFFYFKNGFVIVTKEDLIFKTYDKMPTYSVIENGNRVDVPKVIWKSQIKQHEFRKVKNDEFEKFDWYLFLQNISQKDIPERIETLKILLGYMMHGYMDKKMKSVIVTDSNVAASAEGRSGKTLLGRGMQMMLNADKYSKVAFELNGKEFKPDYEFKYQSLGLDTRLVILNDVKKRFKFEALFNDITDGLERMRKGEAPVKLYAKFFIPTNETIELSSGSARDRAVEFELSNHYNHAWQPNQDFKKWFFNEWDSNDWDCFYNIMLHCVQLFLKNGLPKKIKSINLEKRKLLDETCQEFIDFMEDKITLDCTNKIDLIPESEFDEKGKFKAMYLGVEKKKLYEEFVETYTDYQKLTSKSFTMWLKKFASFTDNISRIEIIRSNSIETVYLFTKK